MIITYKNFTFYFLLLVLTFLLLYSYIVLRYKILYMNTEYPIWLDVKIKSTSDTQKDYNFILLGDSRAKAGFIPKVFDSETMNSVNLSISGSTPIEGYYILKKYLKYNIAPKHLLLSYSPAYLSGHGTYWQRTVKFNFLDYQDYREISSQMKTLNDEKVLGNDNYLKYLFFTGKYLTEFKNGILGKRWESNQETLNYLSQSKGHFYFGTASYAPGLNDETHMSHFLPSPLINYYLEELLKLAAHKNIKIYWFTMPFNETSYVALKKGFKENYDDYIHKLSTKYNIKVLNELYYLEDSNFGDPSHLFSGSKDVSKKIKEILK